MTLIVFPTVIKSTGYMLSQPHFAWLCRPLWCFATLISQKKCIKTVTEGLRISPTGAMHQLFRYKKWGGQTYSVPPDFQVGGRAPSAPCSYAPALNVSQQTTTNWLQLNPHCLRRKCSRKKLTNLVLSNAWFVPILADDHEIIEIPRRERHEMGCKLLLFINRRSHA